MNKPWAKLRFQTHNNSSQFMKLSRVNFHELAMNRIRTYQVYNNLSKWWTLPNNHELNNETYQGHNISSQFMKQSLVNFHELAMKQIEIYQVHNKSSKFTKLSRELSWTSLNYHSSWTFMNKPWTKSRFPAHNNSSQFMKLFLVNAREVAMNWIKTYLVHNNSSKWWTLTNNHELNNGTYQVHNNSSQFMKQSLVNFHELAMNRIKTFQVHKKLSMFMKLSHKLSWTSDELNWSYQVHKKSWLLIKLFIWTSLTKSWTTLVHPVLINIHDLSWTVFHKQFMNTFHELDWWTIDEYS